MIPNPGRAGHKLRKWPNGIVHYIYDASIGKYDRALVTEKLGLRQCYFFCLFIYWLAMFSFLSKNESNNKNDNK